MAKLKAGVIGAGWVSGEPIAAYVRNPHVEFVGIASRTREGAERKAREVGVDCRVYDTVDQLIDDPEINLVSICSPPNVHAEQVIKCAQAGKHLVIEKPVAMNRVDVWRMQDAVRAAGVKTVVSFVLRWNPLFETIKSLLAQGALGNIFYLEADYWHWVGPHYGQYRWSRTKEAGGSSLLSAGCHAVDALRWFGGEIVEVSGYSAPKWAGSDYEFDPNVVAAVKFASGAIGKVSSSLECRTPYIFNIEILGDQGTLRNNRLYSRVLFPGQTDYAEFPTILPDSGDVTHHPFQGQIDHFVECILEDRESHCNLDDATKTMEVCFAIDESIETGKPVRLPLDRQKAGMTA